MGARVGGSKVIVSVRLGNHSYGTPKGRVMGPGGCEARVRVRIEVMDPPKEGSWDLVAVRLG
jgi:hypothetical protein